MSFSFEKTHATETLKRQFVAKANAKNLAMKTRRPSARPQKPAEVAKPARKLFTKAGQ